jgi:hypothetical protein
MQPTANGEPLTPRVVAQIAKAGPPLTGVEPFIPAPGTDSRNRQSLKRAAVQHGLKRGQIGYLDTAGRIWIRDRAHAGLPDHWDVQENGGQSYFRVDDNGNIIP